MRFVDEHRDRFAVALLLRILQIAESTYYQWIKQAGGTSITAAARRMAHAAVKRLPVVDDSGRLIGIVSRADLLKVHLRPDAEILADVQTNVLLVFLADVSDTITVAVVDGVVALSGRLDRWSSAEIAVRLTRQVAGVVDVVSSLGYDFDDRNIGRSHPIAGSALTSADALLRP